jgi:hypothetical protein
MGREFLTTYALDTGRAWTQIMLSVMRHLALLAASDRVQNLKELLAVAREVEEHIRKTVAVGGGRDGEQRLPMDEIGSRWRVEQQSDESAATPTPTKKRLRQRTASASKSTISKELPSSNGKTNSETHGSEP